MKPVHIGIMGTPVSSGNQGVLALGASLVNLCTAAGQGKVVLLLGHKDNKPVNMRVEGQLEPIKVVNYRLSPRSRICDHLSWIIFASFLYRVIPISMIRKGLSRKTPWISAIEAADIIGDVRGGDSFSDIYGMRRFFIGFLSALSVLFIKGKMVQFPQTFGPYKSWSARIMARYILKKSSVIMARDVNSKKNAEDLIGTPKKIWLSPDVAFSLEAMKPKDIDMFPPLTGEEMTSVVGININGLIYNGGYTRKNMFGLKIDYPEFVLSIVISLLREHSGELWMVPHTYAPPDSVESDTDACHKIRNALPKALKRRVRIVCREYNQHELKGIIGKCDFFVGSRMHACIAALSQGVPCVGVAYSMKFEGVFESVGMKEWVVDCRNIYIEEAVTKIIELYHKREKVRPSLTKSAINAIGRLNHIFNELMISADI